MANLGSDPSEQYIHPIIQAMFGALDRINQQKQQKIENDQKDTEAQLRQNQFDETKRQHDQEFAREAKLLEISQNAERDRQELQKIQESGLIQNMILGGYKPKRSDLQVPGQQFLAPDGSTQTMPGSNLQGLGDYKVPGTNFSFDPSQFTTPEEAFNQKFGQQQQEDQRQIQNAGSLETAQQTALEPFKIKEDDRVKANRIAEYQIQGANSARTAEINHQNDMDKAREETRRAVLVEGMRLSKSASDGIDPDVISNNINQIQLGQTSLSALPKDIKEAVVKTAGKFRIVLPSDSKGYAQNLQNSVTVQKILNQARDLAVNHSGIVEGVKTYLPFTDAGAALDELKSNANALATVFEQQKRTSDADTMRKVAGLYSPTNTKEQNTKNLSKMQDLLNGVVKRNFAGMPAAQVNSILGQLGISDLGGFKDSSNSGPRPVSKNDPQWLQIAPQTNPNGSKGPIDPDKSIELGRPIYLRAN